MKIYLHPELREILKVYFLTGKEIADKIGITRDYFYTLCKGVRPIGVKSAKKLWEILEKKGIGKEDIFKLY